MMTRVLVLGGSGLLGRALMRRLGPRATGVALMRSGPGLVRLDARELSSVLDLVRSVRPEVVVNLIAERRPAYWQDPDELHRTNVTTAGNAARAARDGGAALVHVSTDYVFPSGGPFAPDAPHAPTNAYGQTKSAAESEVRQVLPRVVVIRMPVLYGPVETAGECNLAELVTRIALARELVELDSWAQRRPTHVADVARSLEAITGSADRWAGRSVHLSARQWYSQYEMGLRAARLLGVDPGRIRAVEKPADDRPRRIDLALEAGVPSLSGYRSLAHGLPALLDGYLAASGAS